MFAHNSFLRISCISAAIYYIVFELDTDLLVSYSYFVLKLKRLHFLFCDLKVKWLCDLN